MSEKAKSTTGNSPTEKLIRIAIVGGLVVGTGQTVLSNSAAWGLGLIYVGSSIIGLAALGFVIRLAIQRSSVEITNSEPSSKQPDDSIERLKSLVDLRDSGAVSAEEFEVLKKQVIDGQ